MNERMSAWCSFQLYLLRQNDNHLDGVVEIKSHWTCWKVSDGSGYKQRIGVEQCGKWALPSVYASHL